MVLYTWSLEFENSLAQSHMVVFPFFTRGRQLKVVWAPSPMRRSTQDPLRWFTSRSLWSRDLGGGSSNLRPRNKIHYVYILKNWHSHDPYNSTNFWCKISDVTNISCFEDDFFSKTRPQLMIDWIVGLCWLVVWIPRIPLWKRLLLRGIHSKSSQTTNLKT